MVLHALFGNEQDGCSNHQAAADHIEDGGADAAGAGQGSADIVLNLKAHTAISITSVDFNIRLIDNLITDKIVGVISDLDLHRSGQNIITTGCFGLVQVIFFLV